jgi:hypothetical protein
MPPLRFRRKTFRKGAVVYRGDRDPLRAHVNPHLIPRGIVFYAMSREVAAAYGHVNVFETTAPLSLLEMSVGNLKRLLAAFRGDDALARAVAAVTGVGLKVDQKFRSLRFRPAAMRLAEKMCNVPHLVPAKYQDLLRETCATVNSIARKRTDALEMLTTGYLSAQNQDQQVYAAKRLALELQRVLSSGKHGRWDGWYFDKSHTRAGTGLPFIEQVMLWNADSKIRLQEQQEISGSFWTGKAKKKNPAKALKSTQPAKALKSTQPAKAKPGAFVDGEFCRRDPRAVVEKCVGGRAYCDKGLGCWKPLRGPASCKPAVGPQPPRPRKRC